MTDPSERPVWPTVALLCGFVAVAIAIASAYRRPATGYELSLYSATPTAFWVGCGLALAASIAVVTVRRADPRTPVALALAGTSVLSIAALPVVRGYYFYGLGDSLTHLGWTRAIAAGESPLQVFYPGTHLIAAALSTLGYEPTDAMLLVVVLFTLSFFLFVPLTVRSAVSDRRGTVVAAFAGLLLPPIYVLGTSYMFAPYTLSLLFVPMVLYLLVKYVPVPDRDRRVSPRAVGGLLVFAGVALLLFHSQLLADVLVVLGTVAVIQLAYRRLRPQHSVASHRLLLPHVVVLGLLFAGWNLQYELMFDVLNGIASGLFGDSQAGVASTVSQRGNSLQDIGASTLELALKLFLVNAVLSLVTAGLFLAVLFDRARRLPVDARGIVYYLGIGGIALLPVAAAHAFGVSSSFLFRHVGFGMVLVTVVGSLGVYYLTRSRSFPGGRWVLSGSAAVLLVLALAIVFPSPYVYLPNQHVTEAQMDGYASTFEHEQPGIQYAGIRGGAERFSSSLPGVSDRESEHVNASMIDAGLADQFDNDTYVLVSDVDRQRELEAYRGLRYDGDDFDDLARTNSLARVSSNGDVTVYYVDAPGA